MFGALLDISLNVSNKNRTIKHSINIGKVVPRSVICMLDIKRVEKNVGLKFVSAITKPRKKIDIKKKKTFTQLKKP